MTDKDEVKNKKRMRPKRRDEQRGTFWNIHPSRTPPALSFPKISTLLERAQRLLPVAKARDKFLLLMAETNAVSSGCVLLVTREMGCRKVR